MKRFLIESGIGLCGLLVYTALWNSGFIDWGFHHLFYFGKAWVVGIGIPVVLMAAALDSFPAWTRRTAKALQGHGRLWITLSVLLIAVMGWAFFRFFQYYPLLGDSAHILELIREGHGAYEYGFIKLYHFLLPLFASHFPQLPEYKLFYFTHPVWGVIYLAGLLMMARGIGRNEAEKLILFVGGMALGTIQYFFGYTESYAMAIAFQPLYFLFAIRFLDSHRIRDLVLSVMVLLMLMVIHFANMFLLFSWLALVMFHFGRNPKLRYRRLIFGLLGLISFLVVGVGIYKWLIAGNLIGYLHSLVVGFSPFQNLLDFLLQDLNYISLSGIINLVGFFLLIAAWLNGRIRRQTMGEPRLFFLMIGSSAVVLLHIFFPWFCFSAMDWDAASVNALILFLWTVEFIYRFDKARFYSLVSVLLLVTAVNTIAWVGVNHSPEKSIRRYQDLMQLNKVTCRRSGVGSYYALKNHNVHLVSQMMFNYLKLKELSLAEAQKALEFCDGRPDDALLYNNLGHEFYIRSRYDDAGLYFRKAVAAAPEFVLARLNLLKLLLNESQADSIAKHLAYLEESFRTASNPRVRLYYPEYYSRVVEYLLLIRQYEQARQVLPKLEEAIAQSTRNTRYQHYIRFLRYQVYIFVNLNDFQKTLQVIEELKRYVPEDPLIESITREISNRSSAPEEQP
ncbi:MAG: hypothetical protein KBA26_10470 [Candidatus Delongbacteria bacterium]|nr:hypothetical protein [Candidatus Delongbacteria bacterium]